MEKLGSESCSGKTGHGDVNVLGLSVNFLIV